MTLSGTILRPFGMVFQLKLFGPLESPEWRFAIDPRNIFENPVDAYEEKRAREKAQGQGLGPLLLETQEKNPATAGAPEEDPDPSSATAGPTS